MSSGNLNFELTLAQTQEVARVRHQLALGLSFIDSNSGHAILGPWVARLEAIGNAPLAENFQRHRADRLAARFAGTIQKRMQKLLAAGDPTTWTLRAFGSSDPNAAVYQPQLDPRFYVPRRLSMELVLSNGLPASSAANIRMPRLWPGARYPFTAGSTLIRGRVLQGANLSSARALPWARLYATVPDTELVFANAQQVGCGHGDDRGEYVLALDARAATGAALKNPLPVRLWAFAAAQVTDPVDALAGLPIEPCGQAADSPVLRGIALPAGYSLAQSRAISLRLGQTLSGSDVEFLFPP
jgi:hypothetical protein